MEVSCGGAGPTRAEMGGARIDKVNESCTSIEFGEEEGGVGLGFRGGDPLETRSECAIFAAAFAEDSAPIAAHSHFLERETEYILNENKEMRKKGNEGYIFAKIEDAFYAGDSYV